MSEIVERVAREIHEGSLSGLDFETLRERRLRQARAVLTVMREPTIEMIHAGDEIWPQSKETWIEMIDAALSQSGEG